jgi:hypothetical protein
MGRARQMRTFDHRAGNVVADVVAKNDTPLMQLACFRFFTKILLGTRFVKSDAPLTPNAYF